MLNLRVKRRTCSIDGVILRRWVKTLKSSKIFLLEEFKDRVRPDIRSHLDEQKVEELEKAAITADYYAVTHKMSIK